MTSYQAWLLLLLTTGPAVAWPQEVPRLPPAPTAPTSNQECANFAKAVNDLTTSMSNAHWDCISAHMKELGLFATDGGSECAVAVCRQYHNFVHGEAPKEGERQISACYDRVRQYRQQLAQEEHVIQQEGEQQRAAISAGAQSQLSTLDASRAASDARVQQANAQAAQQRQIANDAQRLADVYRNQAQSVPGSHPTLSAAQLAVLEEAQRQAELSTRSYDPFNAAGGTAGINVDSTEFRNAVRNLLREDALDYLQKGLKYELKHQGVEGEAIVETWEMGETAVSTWNKFASVVSGQSTPDGTLRTAAEALGSLDGPLIGPGVNAIVHVHTEGTLAMADHAFGAHGPLFSTDPASDGATYDMTGDLKNTGLQLKAIWPGFDKLIRAADAIDAGGRLVRSGVDAFNKFLYY